MIVALVPIIFTVVSGYYAYTKFVSEKLDSPANSEAVKGLEKDEIKTAIKDNETKKKDLEKEVKDLEKERKDILAGTDTDKADQAQAKLEEKQTKQEELNKITTELADLKVAEKGGYWAMMPNKFTWNNALWIGGLLVALMFIYKLAVQLFRSLFRSIGFEE